MKLAELAPLPVPDLLGAPLLPPPPPPLPLPLPPPRLDSDPDPDPEPASATLSALFVRLMTGVRVNGESMSLYRRPRRRSPKVHRMLGSTAIMRLRADRVSRGSSRKMLSAAPDVNVVCPSLCTEGAFSCVPAVAAGMGGIRIELGSEEGLMGTGLCMAGPPVTEWKSCWFVELP